MDKATIIKVLEENKVKNAEAVAQQIIDQLEQHEVIERMASEGSTQNKDTLTKAVLAAGFAMGATLLMGNLKK